MCSWEASDRPQMCRVLIISFNLLISNTEQMLRETLTWGRSHTNQWQNQDWVPGPRDPSGCANSQICYILPGCLWPIRCDFLNTRSFSLSLMKTVFFELLPGLLLKSTRMILEPVMLLAHSHHHNIFIFLRNRLVRCRLIHWVLKPGVMGAGWDGDLSQEHKVPGPVRPHLVCELLYTILLNSYLCLLLNERKVQE